ncbi:hypothetical protein LDL08_28115 [Nonomuraea glycinis]|uniref:Uncharacterized protein n=1 Tax=Nonomuraea glycinis TaxID=2047744 RepID=A0A918A9A8_9ACTN|nr:hypothetical protein [Nonomuraea glycinis]MCA2180053.1 hypothetical protein [Nonomuraea glycinis]WSG71381.1 hypothetical protein OHA68_18575 [Nonomuraea glycinis]GGP10780.1 hypothetical protein GCM10012278_51790 [Nonomuraea glycinis]
MTVTPEHLTVLASRAEALTAEVLALCDSAPGPAQEPEPEHLAVARQAADSLAGGAEGLRRAAAELVRLQARPCGLSWGVCPEHGNTLSSSGGVSTCRVCRRDWSHDRLGQPCQEPVTWKVIDRAGTETRMCDGHVLGARAVAAGATFVRVPDEGVVRA